ncbi:unnamed protein product [Gemmataceae bacterium]|nr:unnamed protein product [Gemmataceae bacterium]VTT99164.1 unnamed protein product [Gemmataceae bacterium]
MTRSALAALLLVALPAAAHAQPLSPGIAASPAGGFGSGGRAPLAPGIAASPAGGFGGGWRSPVPAAPSPIPLGPKYPCGGGVGGGFGPACPAPGFPFSGIWTGGYGFGGAPYYGYGFGYAPTTSFSFVAPTYDPPPIQAGPNLAIGDEFPAVLTLEFPAAAEVWVNGKKGDGKPTTEWTLTSPLVKTGTEYTFDVKARWTVNGKTYEYTRTVNVGSGNRSRALVVAGVELKE